MPRRGSLLVAVLVTAACVAAGLARAHGTGAHSGFQARVSYLEPSQPGVLVQVLGGHVRLSLANLTQKTIVVPGAEGRRDVRIRPGRTEVWVEPRIGATEAPPTREGLVRNWTIPATADRVPFDIVGFLGYRPPADMAVAEEDDGGTSVWLIAAAIGGGVLVLAAALAVPLLRRDPEDGRGRA
jgi:hypothetical protein